MKTPIELDILAHQLLSIREQCDAALRVLHALQQRFGGDEQPAQPRREDAGFGDDD